MGALLILQDPFNCGCRCPAVRESHRDPGLVLLLSLLLLILLLPNQWQSLRSPMSTLPTPNAIEQSFTGALGLSRTDRWEQAVIRHNAHVPGNELDESAKKCPIKGADPQQIVLY